MLSRNLLFGKLGSNRYQRKAGDNELRIYRNHSDQLHARGCGDASFTTHSGDPEKSNLFIGRQPGKFYGGRDFALLQAFCSGFQEITNGHGPLTGRALQPDLRFEQHKRCSNIEVSRIGAQGVDKRHPVPHQRVGDNGRRLAKQTVFTLCIASQTAKIQARSDRNFVLFDVNFVKLPNAG